jgi:NAD(P)-dependent dehydrogenase (short-subunit alcohol dehydrogenase family)
MARRATRDGIGGNPTNEGRRSPRLAEVAATAAFLASEKASAITGTFVNVTSGTFPN